MRPARIDECALASCFPSLPPSLLTSSPLHSFLPVIPPVAATAVVTPADATILNPDDEALVIVGTLGLKVKEGGKEGGRDRKREMHSSLTPIPSFPSFPPPSFLPFLLLGHQNNGLGSHDPAEGARPPFLPYCTDGEPVHVDG